VRGTEDAVPRRRRFAIVTETYLPEVNGVAMTLGQLVDGLGARGHAVSLIRPRQHARDGRSARWERVDVSTTLVPAMPLPGYAGLQMGVPAGATLRDEWRRRRPDAVYVATEGPLGYSAVRTARRLGIRVLGGFHTNFHGYLRHYHAAWLQHVALGYLRHVHNLMDGTIVATADLRRRLQGLGFTNLQVLGRGVDTQRFRPERRCGAHPPAISSSCTSAGSRRRRICRWPSRPIAPWPSAARYHASCSSAMGRSARRCSGRIRI
jgi:hypothetical protein